MSGYGCRRGINRIPYRPTFPNKAGFLSAFDPISRTNSVNYHAYPGRRGRTRRVNRKARCRGSISTVIRYSSFAVLLLPSMPDCWPTASWITSYSGPTQTFIRWMVDASLCIAQPNRGRFSIAAIQPEVSITLCPRRRQFTVAKAGGRRDNGRKAGGCWQIPGQWVGRLSISYHYDHRLAVWLGLRSIYPPQTPWRKPLHSAAW